MLVNPVLFQNILNSSTPAGLILISTSGPVNPVATLGWWADASGSAKCQTEK